MSPGHLNFQQNRGQPSPLDDVISVFTAPRLKPLVLVGVEFSFNVFNWRQIYADGLTKRGSPVERLSLHQCHIPPKASEILLSMPRSLKYLSYITDGWRRRWGDDVDARTGLWENFFSMCEHLAQQEDSLAQLDVDLTGLPDGEVYETQHFGFRLAHLTSLTDLTIKYRFPDDPENGRMLLSRFPLSLRRLSICDFPYATNGKAMAVAAQYYLTKDLSTDIGFQESVIESVLNEQCKQKSKLLPNLEELSISFADYKKPGTIAERLRKSFEYIGDRYKRELGWRFVVNRITEMRGAVPPYLWDEHGMEFVNVYDNMAENDLWDSKSDYEIEKDKERKRAAERARMERAAQDERERVEVEEERRRGLLESVSPPSPPPSISPANGSLPQFVATASPADMTVIAAALAMPNAVANVVLGGLNGGPGVA